jgi:putative restriction endonuclease
VNDKFIRKLRPDIKGLPQFDRLLTDWLAQGSNELKKILLNHTSDYQDRELINNAFYIAPEPDIPLAQEFEFDPNEQSFKEGKAQLRLHLNKERNQYLVKLAKESWRRSSNGKLRCAACNFSFPETYGQVGDGFVEAHHKAPIATLVSDTVVRIADLAPVCSNCHSMLHRRRPWLTVEQLRDIVAQQNKHCSV